MSVAPLSRRAWLMGLSAAAFSRVPLAGAAGFCSDADGLRTTPGAIGTPLGEISPRIEWGVSLGSPAIEDDALVAALGRERPRVIAIANALKFGDRAPRDAGASETPGRWKECDDIVALALQLGAGVRGDALAWNEWLPDWVKALARERPSGWRDTLRDAFEGHFKAVFAHFGDLRHTLGMQPLRWCGLVNEPFNPWKTSGGFAGYREGPWLDAYGTEPDGVPGYIHRAFALAERHAPPGAALFLNETYCDEDRFSAVVRPSLLRLVDFLQRAGRKVDAVGLECHLMPQWMRDPKNPDWKPFAAFLADLARRGVAIYLTELDVNDCSVRDAAERDAMVERYTRSFVAAALEVPAVTMVTNWDFSDKYSWLREDGTPSAVYPSLAKWADCVARPPCPRPDIYDQSMRPKIVRDGLAQALRARG